MLLGYGDRVNHSIVRTLFRVFAFAEAVSWLLLLIAMFFKWVLEAEPFGLREGGVPIAGMLHGAVFLMLYLAITLVAFFRFGWNFKTGVLALFSAIPPFMTVWFERKALREGLLEPQPTES